MSQRGLIALLYIVGAAVTTAGVLLAYLAAAKQKAALDQIATWSDSLPEVDLVEIADEAQRGDDDAQAAQAAAGEARNAERARRLREVGIDRDATWNDIELPTEFWSRRTALADLLSSFRSGGLTALVGLVLLTTASVWSLYLPGS